MAQLAQGPRLELAHALPRDPELDADLLERPAAGAVQAVAEHDQHALEPRLQLRERPRELRRAKPKGRLRLGLGRVHVLDQVAHHALAVADRRLEAHVVLHEVEQLRDPERRQLGLGGDLVERRVATQLLAERPARALHAAHLVGDVDGQPDRPALLGERPLDGLPDPPGRVRRELEAHRPVELVDRRA